MEILQFRQIFVVALKPNSQKNISKALVNEPLTLHCGQKWMKSCQKLVFVHECNTTTIYNNHLNLHTIPKVHFLSKKGVTYLSYLFTISVICSQFLAVSLQLSLYNFQPFVYNSQLFVYIFVTVCLQFTAFCFHFASCLFIY